MSAEEHRIYIGTTGWNHANWKDSFYPDDLPDEWALTYYSNEIPVVYLPQSLNWDQMVGELLENSNDKFRFLLGLEIDATLLSPQLLDAIEQLSDRLLGLVLRLNPEQVSPEQFEAVLDQLQGYRVVLDTGSQMNSVSALDTSWQGCLRKHHIELSVYAENPPVESEQGELGVVFMAHEYEPRGLRDIIEPCLKLERADRMQALIMTSPTPSLEMIRNAKVITDLL